MSLQTKTFNGISKGMGKELMTLNKMEGIKGIQWNMKLNFKAILNFWNQKIEGIKEI